MANNPKYSSDSYIPVIETENTAKICRGLNTFPSKENRCIPFNSFSGTLSDYHWKKKKVYANGVIGLHEEVNDFYEVMKPTEQETDIRLKVVEDITHTVHTLWPLAKVEVFGSFRTGLYLPSSDIDVVILGEWQSIPLYTLKEALMKKGISSENITIIGNATVPIVRLVHAASQIRVDISFNMKNGVKAAKLIKELVKQHPALPKLVLVLKQFLVHRDLNEVYNGGMSSYCLTLLIVSFLQGFHKPKTSPSLNLGTLLLEFFELYGINFNYDKVSIHFQNGGHYQQRFSSVGGPFLSIEDPLVQGHDVAKGTYLMHILKMSFQNAFYVLSKAVIESESAQIPVTSYLSHILKVDRKVLASRQRLISNYDKIMQSFSNVCLDTRKNDQQESASSSKKKAKWKW